MEKKEYRAGESLGHMTIIAYRVLHAAFRRVFREHDVDITPEQWGIVLLLWEKGSSTQAELADALCVDKSSISRVLALMEEKGLLTRRIDPDNERKKIIAATDAALKLREKAYALTHGILDEAVAGVTAEESAACMKVLSAIRDNLRG